MKEFSLMKSPWYARTSALLAQRCWKSDLLLEVKEVSLTRSPSERR